MAYGVQSPRDRMTSLVAVALIHALLAVLLVRGWTVELAPSPPSRTAVFDVLPEPPPPPVTQPPKLEQKRARPKPKDPEGAAAPPNLRNTPVPVVAPVPVVPLPVSPPITAAPVPATGTRAEAGAATVPGPGTGAGGVGNGRGSGLSGDGTGGGGGGGTGLARPARYLSGSIDDRDWPPGLDVPGFEGRTDMRFTVSPSGRVVACRVVRSSGIALLDRTACRLSMRRLRFRPALDRDGRPTTSLEPGEQEWGQNARPADVWVEPTIPDDE